MIDQDLIKILILVIILYFVGSRKNKQTIDFSIVHPASIKV
jgi:hypothetical protein